MTYPEDSNAAGSSSGGPHPQGAAPHNAHPEHTTAPPQFSHFSPQGGQQSQPGFPPQAYPGGFPPPNFPEQGNSKKSSKKGLIIGIVAALVVIAGVAGGFYFSGSHGSGSSGAGSNPQAAVQGYLDALNANDAEKALSYGLADPPNKDFLTNEILAKEIPAGSLTNIHTSIDTKDEDSARVDYSFQTKGKSIKGMYKVAKSDDSWKLESAFLNVEFPIYGGSFKLKSLTIFGKPVKDDLSKVYVFPGELQFGSSIPGVLIKIKNESYSDSQNYGFHNDSYEDDKYKISMYTDLDDATRNKYKGIITQRVRDCLAHGSRGENCPRYITAMDSNRQLKAINDFEIKTDEVLIGEARFSFSVSLTSEDSYIFETSTNSVSGKLDFTGDQITYSFRN